MSKPAKPQFHRGQKRWYARIGDPVSEGGRSRAVYFPATIRGESEAWDYFRAIQAAAAARIVRADDPTVRGLATLYDIWMRAEVIEGRIGRETVTSRVCCLKLFVFFAPTTARKLESTLARNLRIDDLDAFVRWMLKNEYKGHYVKDVVRAVNAMLNWGARPIAEREPRRILDANPFAGHRLNVATGGTITYVEAESVRRFFRWSWGRANCSPSHATHLRFNRLFLWLLQFLRLTGCRPKEAATATWSDVDWDLGLITLDPKRHKTGRKTGRDRTIFFSGRAAKILRYLHALPGRHPEFIFTHQLTAGALARGASSEAGEPWPHGGPIGQKVRKLRLEAVEAGVDGADGFTAYLMRHAKITDTLLDGGSLSDASKMFGNSPEMISKTYDHTVKDRLAGRAKELDAMRRKGGKK